MVVAAGLVVGRGRRSGQAEAAAVAHFRPAVFFLGAALGRDEDDAGGALGTVDGRRGGILDDRDVVHVGGVDVLEVAFHAVDEYQRRAAVDGVPSADVQRRRLARTAGGRSDVQARDRALEHVGDIQGRAVLDGVCLDDGDGAGQVGLFLGAVTDDDDFVQRGRFLAEDDVQPALAGDDDRLRLIPEGDKFHRRAL